MNPREIVKDLWETAYPDNVGFSEVVKFYQRATGVQKDKMANLCRDNDWDGYKNLIKKVVGIDF
jgi:hypothetical protein